MMRGNIIMPLLFVIIGFGILMTSGSLVNKSATNPSEKYKEAGVEEDSRKSNLQLKTIKFKLQVPETFDCNTGAIVGSNEPYILWAIQPPPGTPVTREGAIKAFYQDEHPLTLGSGDVTPAKSSQDHVVDPNVGDEAARDANGFPYFPALFLSDITTDPNNRSGDSQNGGTPHKPSEIYGAWKALGPHSSTAMNPNNLDMGPGADPFPTEPNVTFKGKTRRPEPYYGAEIIWKAEDLNLEDGHTYRAQFILHDGDSEGDISEGCTTIQY